MMLLGSMPLSNQDLDLRISYPEGRDTIDIFGSESSVFLVFFDVIVFIDDGYEWHNRRKICNSEKK